MRSSLFALALVSCAAAVAEAGAIRGLPRSLENLYSASTFSCLDGSKTGLPLSVINDDYCDCPDGSDEPGTSACANGRFFCANKSSKSKYIAASLVNDGVCDCCDGSDEWASGKCQNTCEADGAEWRRTRAEAIRKAEAGAAARQLYAEEGQKAAAERKASLESLEAALEKAKIAKDEAEKAVQAAEEKEKADASVHLQELHSSTGERNAFLRTMNLESKSKEEVVSMLIGFLKAEKLEGSFVSHVAALPQEDATAPAPRWPTADEVTAAVNEAVEIAAAGGDGSSNSGGDSEIPKTPEGNKARQERDAAGSELNRIEGELRRLKDDSGADFGPDAAFYRLKGKCFNYRSNQYTYEVCPFGSAKQDHTSLGTFAGWGKTKASADGSEVNDYSSMLFSNGAYCWNGPNRSMRITFECGEKEELLDPQEPEKCTYAARFITPAACDAKFARELKLELEEATAAGGHDEL